GAVFPAAPTTRCEPTCCAPAYAYPGCRRSQSPDDLAPLSEPVRARSGHRKLDLGTERRRAALGGKGAIKEALAPVHQSEAVDLGVVARCTHKTLTAPAFTTPHSCKRRMQSKLHLILEVDIGFWHKRQ